MPDPRYNGDHRRLRAQWRQRIDNGEHVDCWRCHQPIHPDEPWDLGHDDHDHTVHRGPEHRGRCNRSTAATRGNRMRATNTTTTSTPNGTPSRAW